MTALIQRVLSAGVEVDGKAVCAINKGMVIFLGVEKGDAAEDLKYLIKKVSGLWRFWGLHEGPPHQ